MGLFFTLLVFLLASISLIRYAINAVEKFNVRSKPVQPPPDPIQEIEIIKPKIKREYSEEFKRHHINHMREIISTRNFNETGKRIEVAIPETNEEGKKLQEMYYQVFPNLRGNIEVF